MALASELASTVNDSTIDETIGVEPTRYYSLAIEVMYACTLH